jgi:hypothetical protein
MCPLADRGGKHQVGDELEDLDGWLHLSVEARRSLEQDPLSKGVDELKKIRTAIQKMAGS